MTMVPAQSLSKQQQKQQRRHLYCGGYGSSGGGVGVGDTVNINVGLMNRFQGYEYCISEGCLGSDTPMAEDESRTDSLNEAAGSSSKDNNNNNDNSNNNIIQEDRDESWLQLSIGAHTHTTTTTHEGKNDDEDVVDDDQVDPTVRRGRLIELDLLSGSSSLNQGRALSAPVFDVGSGEYRGGSRPIMGYAAATLLFQQGSSSSSSSAYQYHLQQHHQQEINWAFRPMPHNYIAAAASSSSSPISQTCTSSGLMPLGSYLSRPFQAVHGGLQVAGGPSTSSDFRVIDPLRRPISGIWFTLQASLNQAQEPFLPQISKSYLRIKDGRMTVCLLMKYLVNKLRLDNESEVEITCRGQQLLPFLTLQHVRDNIWSSRDAVTLLPNSSTSDHVMVLQYGRSAPK